jgi:glutaredoxin
MEVIIYSKDSCPNCILAKNRLKKFNPKILKLGQNISHKEFFKKFPDIKSVPQIIIDNKHIGGYKDLEKWLAFNLLDEDF